MKKLLFILLFIPWMVWGATATLTLKSNLADVNVALSGTSAAGGSMAVATAEFYKMGTNDRTYRVLIYDSSGDLVATSSDGTTGTTEGIKSVPITGTTLVSTETYYVAIWSSGYLDVARNADTWKGRNTASTFADAVPPDPLPAGTSTNHGLYAVRIKNSNGDILLGVSDWSVYTTTVSMNPNVIYWNVGGLVAVSP